MQVELSNTLYWKSFQSTLRCFPFKGQVLNGQGKGRKRTKYEICQELVQQLNESEPLEEASIITYVILKTNGPTVRWDKCRGNQFIDCIGIWGKDGRNYAWAHLRNRRTYPTGVKREWQKPFFWQAREYQYRWSRGGLTRSSDLCQIKAQETQSQRRGQRSQALLPTRKGMSFFLLFAET